MSENTPGTVIANTVADHKTVNQQSVEEGQAVYNRAVLAVYDWWVLGVSNRYIWKCPTALLRSEFSRLASANHLDIGVGTGYYLHHCLKPSQQRLALIDLNDNSLAVAAARSNIKSVEVYRRNVLEPFALDCSGFDSISMNYLLHCIPGTMQEKLSALGHANEYLQPGGVLFGSTILSAGVERSAAAKKLMAIYNGKGIFHNETDSAEVLENGLRELFEHVEFRVVGCVAIFSGRKRLPNP